MLADAVAAPAATTSLLVTMAGLALVLGCIGVYGVLSFLVSRQTARPGHPRSRSAPQRRDVFWLVIKEGATFCGGGDRCSASPARWRSRDGCRASCTA